MFFNYASTIIDILEFLEIAPPIINVDKEKDGIFYFNDDLNIDQLIEVMRYDDKSMALVDVSDIGDDIQSLVTDLVTMVGEGR